MFKVGACLLLVLVGFSKRSFCAEASDCFFFLDLEKELGCVSADKNDSDYLIRYGYKYCRAFQKKAREWNDERSVWVQKTTTCLESELIKISKMNLTCGELEARAFRSHPKCYQQSGFCELSSWQHATIIQKATKFDVVLRARFSLEQAFKLISECQHISGSGQ